MECKLPLLQALPAELFIEELYQCFLDRRELPHHPRLSFEELVPSLVL